MRVTVCLILALAAGAAGATHEPWATIRFPQDEDKWWWDADWWERGRIVAPAMIGRSRNSWRAGGALSAGGGPHR